MCWTLEINSWRNSASRLQLNSTSGYGWPQGEMPIDVSVGAHRTKHLLTWEVSCHISQPHDPTSFRPLVGLVIGEYIENRISLKILLMVRLTFVINISQCNFDLDPQQTSLTRQLDA